MTVAPTQQSYAVSAAHGQDEQYVQHTPIWVIVVRAFQVVLAFVILAMAADLTHGVAMDPVVYALVCGLFTFIVVGYQLISEKVLGARPAYNIWAIMALDLFMAILWLSSLGANAAFRASFTVDVNIDNCYSNGQVVNANYCSVSKRAHILKRSPVLFQSGPAMLSAIAGLSALMWLLFIATLIFHGHTYRLYYEANKKPSADNATVEMKAQGIPMLGPHGPAHFTPAAGAGAPYGAGPQYSEQQQYQSQMYPPHEQPQHQSQMYPPHEQPQQPYPPQPQQQYPPQQQQQQQQHQQYPPQQQQQHPGAQPYPEPSYQAQQYPQQPHELQHQQPAYSPHGTPAPGEPYYPPQQYAPQ